MITDNEARQNISVNLSRILAQRGITQAALAKAIGRPVMTVNRLVRGENEPRIALVACVAEALDVAMERLIAEPKGLPVAHLQAVGSEKALSHS